MKLGQEYTLKELWEYLCDKEDITITVDIVKTEYIRRGLAKEKHKEKAKLGIYADPTIKFKSLVLPQSDEEKGKGMARIRLQLLRETSIIIHGVQTNDENDFES